jgi:hypothetical protein
MRDKGLEIRDWGSEGIRVRGCTQWLKDEESVFRVWPEGVMTVSKRQTNSVGFGFRFPDLDLTLRGESCLRSGVSGSRFRVES